MRTNDIRKTTIFLERNFYKILLISVVTFIIACFVIANRDGNSINKNLKFTIATTVSEWHHKNNNGVGVDYEYIVNNKTYKKTRNVDAKKGDRYLIVFDSINPKRSCLIFFHKIEPTYKIKTKNSGWNENEVPVKVDISEIKKYVKEIVG